METKVSKKSATKQLRAHLRWLEEYREQIADGRFEAFVGALGIYDHAYGANDYCYALKTAHDAQVFADYANETKINCSGEWVARGEVVELA